MTTEEYEVPGGASTPFNLEVGGSNERPRLVVSGEIDVATSPILREQLASLVERGARDCTIDIADVSFVDSSGLGVLVGIYKRLAEADGAVHVVGAQPAVRKVFEITGLEAILLEV
jgi:anti-sigma B factor antagonist